MNIVNGQLMKFEEYMNIINSGPCKKSDYKISEIAAIDRLIERCKAYVNFDEYEDTASAWDDRNIVAMATQKTGSNKHVDVFIIMHTLNGFVNDRSMHDMSPIFMDIIDSALTEYCMKNYLRANGRNDISFGTPSNFRYKQLTIENIYLIDLDNTEFYKDTSGNSHRMFCLHRVYSLAKSMGTLYTNTYMTFSNPEMYCNHGIDLYDMPHDNHDCLFNYCKIVNEVQKIHLRPKFMEMICNTIVYYIMAQKTLDITI